MQVKCVRKRIHESQSLKENFKDFSRFLYLLAYHLIDVFKGRSWRAVRGYHIILKNMSSAMTLSESFCQQACKDTHVQCKKNWWY